jgi:hypothetical protein
VVAEITHLQRSDRRDLLGGTILSQIQFVPRLQIEPELRRDAEVALETQRRVSRYPSLAVHDLIDPSWGYTDGDSELVLSDLKLLDEILHEDLARVNRGNFVSGSQRSPPPLVQSPSTRSRCATGH